MELIAAIVAAVLGWKYASLGRQEVKAIAIVVLGWTTVTTVAGLPYISVTGILAVLALRTFVIAVPYAIAALASRWRARRRRS